MGSPGSSSALVRLVELLLLFGLWLSLRLLLDGIGERLDLVGPSRCGLDLLGLLLLTVLLDHRVEGMLGHLSAHGRLHQTVDGWQERYPGVDIVLIEPDLTDELMFRTSMMNFASRIEIAKHGFESVTYHLAGEFERYREISERHGLRDLPERLQVVVDRFESKSDQSGGWRRILEGTTSALLRQSGLAS